LLFEDVGPLDDDRELVPNAHFFDILMNRPLIPRRRDATWSFQVATHLSIEGTMDWVTISRMNVLMAVVSDS
jgi:hypothetical protein